MHILIRKAIPAVLLTGMACTAAANAHDTWLQPSQNIVRCGDMMHVDLLLGNHGNHHRDYKIAGKADGRDVTLTLTDPEGKVRDVKGLLRDQGLTEEDGCWSLDFAPAKPGLYVLSGTSDKVMSYAPERSVKTFKTLVFAAPQLDKPQKSTGFSRLGGKGLEIVPVSDPVTALWAGGQLSVAVYFNGRPLPDNRIAFIPRGQVLQGEMDPRFEMTTDAQGRALFRLPGPGYYLIVSRLMRPAEKGEGYDRTKYGATLCLNVAGGH